MKTIHFLVKIVLPVALLLLSIAMIIYGRVKANRERITPKITKILRVYLAEQRSGNYEIYINGKPSGTYVTQGQLTKLLDRSQLILFKEDEETVFFIKKDHLAVFMEKYIRMNGKKAFNLDQFHADNEYSKIY